ncbi:MAG: FAD-dependent oxidoreductase [Halovenus sp.]
MGYTPHVLVVGGGATGVATARDLAIRGLDVTLVERGRLTAGATGRMQGLLYSGATLARESPALATRCLAENRRLQSVAGHCIVDTGGLVVRHEGDPTEPFDEQLAACRECEIPAEEVTGEQAREREPALDPAVDRALAVPDATVDPFRLTVATARDAMNHGAEIYTRVRVTDIVVEDGAVAGAVVQADPPAGTDPDSVDLPGGEDGTDEDGAAGRGTAPGETAKEVPGQARTGVPGSAGDTGDTADSETSNREDESGAEPEGSDGRSGQQEGPDGEGDGQPRPPEREVQADVVVNAAGGWAGEIAALAGIELPVNHAKGAIAVTDAGEVDTVVRRCRDGTGANTAVPIAGNCMLGTTSEAAAGPGEESGDPSAADRLRAELGAVVPAVGEAQTLRTYWGVRSTVADCGATETVIDHNDRDGTWGLVTVASANLTTHRLAAKRVTDHICSAFGIRRECRTAELPLPGGDGELADAMDEFDVESPVTEHPRSEAERPAESSPVVCECMGVTRAEINAAFDDETGIETDLGDVRIRTWAAMGECQGGRCAHRMASELYPNQDTTGVTSALAALHEERWRGQRHGLSGEALTRAMRNYLLHVETMNRDRPPAGIDLDDFDDGPDWEANQRDRWGGGMPQ